MKRLLYICVALVSVSLCACAAPAAPPAVVVTPAPTATPAVTPVQNKLVAIQGADGKLQFVDPDSIRAMMDNPSDVCHAGEDIPLNHCPDCPQATEGYNTEACSEFSACCPFCPYAFNTPAYAGCQASSMMDEAERQAALAKLEETPAP